MASIFNIFGSHDETIKIQKPSTGTYLDAPHKLRAKSDSSNVYGKRVLGDIRNTLQPTNKNVDAKEHISIKSKSSEDCSSASCSRTPLLPKPQGIPKMVQKTCEKSKQKNLTVAPLKFCDLPKNEFRLSGKENSVKSGMPSKHTNSKFSPLFREMILKSPELQGPNPAKEDNFEDIWPTVERPTLQDFKRLMVLEDNKKTTAPESPLQMPCFVEDTGLITTLGPEEELPEPEIQGPSPVIEDDYEDIWPVSKRPVLDDYKRTMVFCSNTEPEDLEYPPMECVEDKSLNLDFFLIPPQMMEEDIYEIPQPTVSITE